MSPFSLFQVVSVLLVLVSVRVLVETLRRWRWLFDETLTPRDRQQLAEIAFFLLLPIGVLLHELGHVVAVWQAGGTVVGFGLLFFLGWVEHTGTYSNGQLYWIALSGNLVNLFLGLTALLVALSGRFGYAINWLLLVFGGLELVTVFVFYPALDLTSGLHGDWTILYRSGGALGTAVTAAVHVSALLFGLLTWRSGWFRRLVEVRTGVRWTRRLPAREVRTLALNLVEAAEQVARTWRPPVEAVTGIGPGHAGVALRWESGGVGRQIEAIMLPDHAVVELRAELIDRHGSGHRLRQPLGCLDQPLRVDALAELLTHLMGVVESWPVRVERSRDDSPPEET